MDPTDRFGPLDQLLRRKSRTRRAATHKQNRASVPATARNDLAPLLELVTRKVDRLTYPDRNVRGVDPRQVERIARSIGTFGHIVPVLIDPNNRIIEGVIRVEAARLLGLTEIQCIVVKHLTPSQVKRFRVAANRLQERGSWDLDELKIQFEEMIAEDFDLSITGFDDEQLDIILQDDVTNDFLGGEGAELDRSRAPITQPGDILRLGKHRVICGDARDPAVLQAIMDQGLARIVLTDQPYNVKVKGNVTRGSHHREFAMASGEMSDPQFATFNHDWMETALVHLVDGGIFGTFIDWGGYHAVHAAAAGLGLEQVNLIVWSKTNAGMGSLYRSQHELLPLYKKGQEPHVNNIQLGKKGRWRSNVWEYAGASSLGSDARAGLKDHPTVKPVAMLEDALIDLTGRGETVLDPFLGSGSTLLAAEHCGRICRGVEIDPHYVDLIARRYEKMTGNSAVREPADAPAENDQATLRISQS